MSERTPTRKCFACGMVVEASHPRGQPGPSCRAPDACTFDLTLEEAWIHWRDLAHQYRQERDAERARADRAEALFDNLAKLVAEERAETSAAYLAEAGKMTDEIARLRDALEAARAEVKTWRARAYEPQAGYGALEAARLEGWNAGVEAAAMLVATHQYQSIADAIRALRWEGEG